MRCLGLQQPLVDAQCDRQISAEKLQSPEFRVTFTRQVWLHILPNKHRHFKMSVQNLLLEVVLCCLDHAYKYETLNLCQYEHVMATHC